nr:MAG TPA: hypothetical protein [Caudoviricetes sp.]
MIATSVLLAVSFRYLQIASFSIRNYPKSSYTVNFFAHNIRMCPCVGGICNFAQKACC